jgi:hypothetical protein
VSKLEFFCEGGVVGILGDTSGPREPGHYGYMPYRGPGHYHMATLLKGGGSVHCGCQTADETVEFTVKSCPQYGVLEISEIKRTPRLEP